MAPAGFHLRLHCLFLAIVWQRAVEGCTYFNTNPLVPSFSLTLQPIDQALQSFGEKATELLSLFAFLLCLKRPQFLQFLVNFPICIQMSCESQTSSKCLPDGSSSAALPRSR